VSIQNGGAASHSDVEKYTAPKGGGDADEDVSDFAPVDLGVLSVVW
jgi:hypothetical protein